MESAKFKNGQKVYPLQMGLSRGLKGPGVMAWPMQDLCDMESDFGWNNPCGILTRCPSQAALGAVVPGECVQILEANSRRAHQVRSLENRNI